MYSRKLALSLAKQHRSCPPAHFKEDPDQKENYQKHLAMCPYCSAGLNDDLPVWRELVEKLQKSVKPAAPEKRAAPVEPGQLRYIRPELSCWRDGFFYSAPLVLVIDRPGAAPDDVLAAQTYYDTFLAGPGDLILNQDQTGFTDLFIECWHTYTLRTRQLGPPVGAVSPEIIETVKNMNADTAKHPPWAPLPMPMTDDHDARRYFRELEVETGYTFSAQAAAEIMEQIERPGWARYCPDADAVRRAVLNMNPDIRWNRTPLTLVQVLCAAGFPDEYLPKAAAGPDERDERTITVNYAVMAGGRLKTFKPLKAMLHPKQRFPEEIAFSGRLLERPAELKGSALVCCLEIGNALIEPDVIHWEAATGFFLIKFALSEDVKSLPLISLIHEMESDK